MWYGRLVWSLGAACCLHLQVYQTTWCLATCQDLTAVTLKSFRSCGMWHNVVGHVGALCHLWVHCAFVVALCHLWVHCAIRGCIVPFVGALCHHFKGSEPVAQWHGITSQRTEVIWNVLCFRRLHHECTLLWGQYWTCHEIDGTNYCNHLPKFAWFFVAVFYTPISDMIPSHGIYRGI